MQYTFLVPRAFIPLDQWSENEGSGSNHFEITEFCPLVPLHSLHLWRMSEMVVARAFVFRLLVKGNKGSGDKNGDGLEINTFYVLSLSLFLSLSLSLSCKKRQLYLVCQPYKIMAYLFMIQAGLNKQLKSIVN